MVLMEKNLTMMTLIAMFYFNLARHTKASTA
jgi:hypothetical protein